MLDRLPKIVCIILNLFRVSVAKSVYQPMDLGVCIMGSEYMGWSRPNRADVWQANHTQKIRHVMDKIFASAREGDTVHVAWAVSRLSGFRANYTIEMQQREPCIFDIHGRENCTNGQAVAKAFHKFISKRKNLVPEYERDRGEYWWVAEKDRDRNQAWAFRCTSRVYTFHYNRHIIDEGRKQAFLLLMDNRPGKPFKHSLRQIGQSRDIMTTAMHGHIDHYNVIFPWNGNGAPALTKHNIHKLTKAKMTKNVDRLQRILNEIQRERTVKVKRKPIVLKPVNISLDISVCVVGGVRMGYGRILPNGIETPSNRDNILRILRLLQNRLPKPKGSSVDIAITWMQTDRIHNKTYNYWQYQPRFGYISEFDSADPVDATEDYLKSQVLPRRRHHPPAGFKFGWGENCIAHAMQTLNHRKYIKQIARKNRIVLLISDNRDYFRSMYASIGKSTEIRSIRNSQGYLYFNMLLPYSEGNGTISKLQLQKLTGAHLTFHYSPQQMERLLLAVQEAGALDPHRDLYLDTAQAHYTDINRATPAPSAVSVRSLRAQLHRPPLWNVSLEIGVCIQGVRSLGWSECIGKHADVCKLNKTEKIKEIARVLAQLTEYGQLSLGFTWVWTRPHYTTRAPPRYQTILDVFSPMQVEKNSRYVEAKVERYMKLHVPRLQPKFSDDAFFELDECAQQWINWFRWNDATNAKNIGRAVVMIFDNRDLIGPEGSTREKLRQLGLLKEKFLRSDVALYNMVLNYEPGYPWETPSERVIKLRDIAQLTSAQDTYAENEVYRLYYQLLRTGRLPRTTTASPIISPMTQRTIATRLRLATTSSRSWVFQWTRPPPTRTTTSSNSFTLRYTTTATTSTTSTGIAIRQPQSNAREDRVKTIETAILKNYQNASKAKTDRIHSVKGTQEELKSAENKTINAVNRTIPTNFSVLLILANALPLFFAMLILA